VLTGAAHQAEQRMVLQQHAVKSLADRGCETWQSKQIARLILDHCSGAETPLPLIFIAR
jgi:hypothetical protein